MKLSNIRMTPTLYVFGIFRLYRTKYMYVQYLYWYTIYFVFGAKFSVSFGVNFQLFDQQKNNYF